MTFSCSLKRTETFPWLGTQFKFIFGINIANIINKELRFKLIFPKVYIYKFSLWMKMWKIQYTQTILWPTRFAFVFNIFNKNALVFQTKTVSICVMPELLIIIVTINNKKKKSYQQESDCKCFKYLSTFIGWRIHVWFDKISQLKFN